MEKSVQFIHCDIDIQMTSSRVACWVANGNGRSSGAGGGELQGQAN